MKMAFFASVVVVAKIELFSTTALGHLVSISKSIVWSLKSEDRLKKNRFCEKKLLTHLQNSGLMLIYLYLISECYHSIKVW